MNAKKLFLLIIFSAASFSLFAQAEFYVNGEPVFAPMAPVPEPVITVIDEITWITGQTRWNRAVNERILMTVNNRPVTLEEFQYIYNKNNAINVMDRKSLEEYLELFINFRLRVEEAKYQGLDTTAVFIRDFNTYRAQLAAPLLTDNEAHEAMLREAYSRMKEEVEVSHILFFVPHNATAADTLMAWQKTQFAQARLRRGDSFEVVAREMSEDPSAIENGGHLGWLTAFQTIYPFETHAFNTPVGTVSEPVRTQIGYHIIKVHDRRATRGEVLASHIMLFADRNDPAGSAAVRERISELQSRALAGENFSELARNYSDDRGSAARGGELPWFGTGRMVPEFEAAAFALTEIGSISEPIQSDFGWHVIKLLDRREVAPFEDVRAHIERHISRDERANRGRESFIASLKKEYDFQVNRANLDEFTALLDGTNLFDPAFQDKIRDLNKPLFGFAHKNFSQADFARFLIDNPMSPRHFPSEIINERFHAFVSEELLTFEDTQLARKHPEFRFLSQEYHDGILLFEISNREIWNRSQQDFDGLTAFFNANRERYNIWEEPRFKGRVVHAKNRASMREAQRIIRNRQLSEVEINRALQAMNSDGVRVRVERGLFVQGDNRFVDRDHFRVRERIEPSADFPLVQTFGRVIHQPEEFTDVRGLVVADYQAHLEERWIKYLRAKFPVVIYRDVLRMVREN